VAFTTEQQRVYQKKRRDDLLVLARARLGGKCSYPGCEETENLEFDHIDPATKVRKISEATNWSPERFWKEVDKCQLLCRLHHIRKGQENGDLPGLPKLTSKDVLDIRASDLTTRELASYYEVSRATIWSIRKRKSWKHIP
jgi:hypothetical protein